MVQGVGFRVGIREGLLAVSWEWRNAKNMETGIACRV